MPRLLCLLVLAAFLAGCGSRRPAAAPAAAPRPDAQHRAAPGQFLHVDEARRTAELTMIAGKGAANNGFNFDGYARGELIVHVPVGWRTTVRFRNAGSRFASCAVVSGPGASAPAFPGASTPDPASGLPAGGTASFSFTPDRPGAYRLASMVPGQEQARMWAVLEVTGGGRPSIGARPGP